MASSITFRSEPSATERANLGESQISRPSDRLTTFQLANLLAAPENPEKSQLVPLQHVSYGFSETQ